MTEMIVPAPTHRSVTVEVPVEWAFGFSLPILAGGGPTPHSIGATPLETAVIEPRVGGRWYKSAKTATSAFGAMSSPGNRTRAFCSLGVFAPIGGSIPIC
jgi:hypothetical protein